MYVHKCFTVLSAHNKIFLQANWLLICIWLNLHAKLCLQKYNRETSVFHRYLLEKWIYQTGVQSINYGYHYTDGFGWFR